MFLKNPLHVIQVFDNSYEYGKDEKSFEQRKDKYAWKENIVSASGMVAHGDLELNGSKIDTSKFLQRNLLLLIDHNQNEHAAISVSQSYIHKASGKIEDCQTRFPEVKDVEAGEMVFSPFHWKCFQIKKAELIELHLAWDYWEIGRPQREDFKLCDLKINEAVEVNINGKRDFSLTGRRKRTFVEKNFIFQYLGEVNEIDIKDSPEIWQKNLPLERKRVNLLKELY